MRCRQSASFSVRSAVLVLLCGSLAQAEVPAWVAYPDKEWRTLTPREAGVGDIEAWNQWVQANKQSARGASFHGEEHSGAKWGVAITRGGYLIQTFGDPDYRFQTASVGKCFTMACLQLAIDAGLIKSADDLIKDYWTGEGQINAKHKYLNEGFHVFLTFNHLKSHHGAFPISNGWSWKAGKNYGTPAPDWAKWTGDPDHDNYAHAKPGTVVSVYSSGGYWRLAQALTAVWKRDLKPVLDERIMSQIGIPADRWDWARTSGTRQSGLVSQDAGLRAVSRPAAQDQRSAGARRAGLGRDEREGPRALGTARRLRRPLERQTAHQFDSRPRRRKRQ